MSLIFYVCDGCEEPVGSKAVIQPIEFYNQRTDKFQVLQLAFCRSCTAIPNAVADVIVDTMAQLHEGAKA